MQTRISLFFLAGRAHCWLTFNWVSIRTPRSFSAKLLSGWVAWGYSSPSAGLCTSASWTSWNASQLTSPACQSHSGQHSPLSESATPQSFVLFCELLRLYSLYPIVQVIKKDWVQYWSLGYSTHYSPPTEHCSTICYPLGLAVQPVFDTPHCLEHCMYRKEMFWWWKSTKLKYFFSW